MSTVDLPSGVFDPSHYAATLGEKVWRSAQLGPRYYLWDLPRYFYHRRTRKLGIWDPAVFTNPLREFQPECRTAWELPPGYPEALQLFADLGLKLTIPQQRLEALASAWWQVRHLSGDVIECGAYQGATSLFLALLGRLLGISQKVLLLDTFAGIPEVSPYDLSRQTGEFRAPRDQIAVIQHQARILEVQDRIEIHKGLFNETFTKLAGSTLAFRLVHIDANVYQATLEACTFTLPRVVPGGIMVFDDYNGVCDLGARLAIDECLAERRLEPQPLAATSAYLRLPEEDAP